MLWTFFRANSTKCSRIFVQAFSRRESVTLLSTMSRRCLKMFVSRFQIVRVVLVHYIFLYHIAIFLDNIKYRDAMVPNIFFDTCIRIVFSCLSSIASPYPVSMPINQFVPFSSL
ncbi:hypothetical protein TRVL_10406 [Trypanosoma vivax]|nr:hypothetical protein TRVL_10406 [Trypanosoma vivax]